jgi:hypothetical protein
MHKSEAKETIWLANDDPRDLAISMRVVRVKRRKSTMRSIPPSGSSAGNPATARWYPMAP